jgi:peptidoglycan/xylan/chitin deacetylase (PgdA/CDA1 family)
MKYIILAAFYLCGTVSMAGELALSFDDAPMRDMNLYSGKERADILIKKLKKYKIQTVFFSVAGNLAQEDRLARMKHYDMANHLIANHTLTHPDFNKTPLIDYIQGFDKADTLLRQFKNFRPWFRFPYLKQGNSLVKRDTMRKHLKKKGYKNGYVTLDIQDWFMAKLLNLGIKNGQVLQENNMCRAYAEMIWDSISYYDAKAIELLKRSPKHFLLLHENDLAALCIDKLIDKIRANNWKVISPDEAMKDPIYEKQVDNLFSNNGQIGALYYESKKTYLGEPWSTPWEDGKLIKAEFKKRKVFK